MFLTKEISEINERIFITLRKIGKTGSTGSCFATMHLYRFFYTACSPIMQQISISSLYIRTQTKAPQWCRSPFRCFCRAFRISVIQSWSHIMHQQISKRINGLIRKRVNRRISRSQCLPVTCLASDLIKQCIPMHNGWICRVSSE